MVRLYWSELAKSDLFNIYQYIASDSSHYAKEHIRNLKSQTLILKQFPESGRIVPEFDDENIREIIFKNYRIVYLIKDSTTVVVITVFHGSRMMGTI